MLAVYKQLSFNFDENGGLTLSDSDELQIHMLILDGSPSIVATGTTSPDLPPT